MINLIDDLKNQGLIEKEEIGFDQIINHIHRAFKDLKEFIRATTPPAGGRRPSECGYSEN